MDIKEIRDKLVEKRTLYNNAVRASQEACSDIRKILSQFSDEEIELLESSGFGITKLLDVDLDKLKSDSDYLENYRKSLTELMDSISDYLLEELND